MKRTVNKKSIKLYLFLILLAIGLWSCDAGYKDWDADESGYLENEEFKERFSEEGHYRDWDVDNDNTINKEEFYGGFYKVMDLDDDYLLDEDEWNKHEKRYMDTDVEPFERWDENNDGLIEYEEFIQNPDNLYGFNDWDTNNNFYLEADEFNDGIFDLYDYNADDQLSDEEYTAFENAFDKNGDMAGATENNE